jgi:molybdopterin synthase sulfur carrier subunit
VPLQNLTGGVEKVEAQGKTTRKFIDDLGHRYSGIKPRLCGDSGELRRFVNFFVNDQDIRFQKGIDTELKDNDEVSIIPAIAGGS